jgi:Uma2 family endonuclease
MASTIPRQLIAVSYEEWAREYLRSLPPEHFMESIGQSTQRKITSESLDLVEARRPDVHVFSELLVQYPLPRQRRPGQVVPDNMVVISDQPITANSSYNLPLEPAGPFWVLEYVSKSNKRKDYKDNFAKYERDLRVPYYLIFHPDDQELTLYRHDGKKYVPVKSNKHGRFPIARLDIDVRILDGWVRFWHKGELLPLPADFERVLDEAKRRADEADRRADEAGRRADEARHRAIQADRRADEADIRAAELRRRLAEAERELAQLRGSAQAPPSRRTNGTKPAK